jgi:hypothetical protein
LIFNPFQVLAILLEHPGDAWALGRVAQHLANLVDGGVQVVVDIVKGVRPQPLLQFVLGIDWETP